MSARNRFESDTLGTANILSAFSTRLIKDKQKKKQPHEYVSTFRIYNVNKNHGFIVFFVFLTIFSIQN